MSSSENRPPMTAEGETLMPPANTVIAYPFGDDMPAAGEWMEVASGIYWLRFPLPFALDHINLYVIDEGDSWTLIDTGVHSPESISLWQGPLRHPMAAKPVSRILVTHWHPDHIGMAGWLAAQTGAPLWITRTEWLMARMTRAEETTTFQAPAISYFQRMGLSADKLQGLNSLGNHYESLTAPIPTEFVRMQAGKDVTIGMDRWQVLIGRGHAPEHACLYCAERQLIIGGDILLPRISPIVGIWPAEPEEDALSDFLTCLQEIRAVVDASALVLPSHNRPYTGVHTRIDDLTAHHDERLHTTRAACQQAMTAAAVSQVLFPRLQDPFQLRLGLAETVAHLNHQRARGLLTRQLGDDGIYRYQAC